MTIGSDENEEQRASIYRHAIDMQMKNPRLAFKDNEEKLRKSLESVRNQYEDFANYFGTDKIVGTTKGSLKNNFLPPHKPFQEPDPDVPAGFRRPVPYPACPRRRRPQPKPLP